MAMVPRGARSATALLLLVALGCNPPTTTQYAVTGTLQTNSCGDGPWNGTPTTPWTFSVGLSESGSSLTWTTSDGSSPLEGSVVSGAVSLTGNSPLQDELPDGGPGPCAVDISTVIDLTLDGGADAGGLPATFTGTYTYTFTPIAGMNCANELSDGGGLYASLPCTVEYTISGVEQ